ncbi:MAG: hypothetical protein OXC83_06930 [Chloroflexi bacterium]|nr:hypothetical protein [Chloroflexota bacterium]
MLLPRWSDNTRANGRMAGRLEVALTPDQTLKLIEVLQGALDDLGIGRQIDDEFREQSSS